MVLVALVAATHCKDIPTSRAFYPERTLQTEFSHQIFIRQFTTCAWCCRASLGLALWAGYRHHPGVFTPDPTMLTHRLCCALRALGKRSGNRTPTQLYRQGERCKTLSFRANDRQLSLQFNFVGKGSDAKEGTGPPQPPLRSAAPPAIQLLRQGERCNTNDISQYKRKIRVCRMDFSRVGPCVRPQPSYISDEWPLLSKGLRGGKERSDREESLLRWMIASEDAKNPLQSRK